MMAQLWIHCLVLVDVVTSLVDKLWEIETMTVYLQSGVITRD